MFRGKKLLVRASLTMVGTIIGAGIFGVPAMMESVGPVVGSVVFWIVAATVLATHLLFVEVIATDGNHRRFPGYIGLMLGPWARRVGVVTQGLGLTGGLFAYLILGGEFLMQILGPTFTGVPLFAWQVIFWVAGVVVLYRALRMIAQVEAALTWLLVALMLGLVLFAAPLVDVGRISNGDWSRMFAPLGVFLFSLFGLTAIPEVHDIAGRRIERTRRAVTIGSFAAALLTWLFGLFIFAAVDPGRAGDIGAMTAILPYAFRWVLPCIGFLAVATSFITIAYDLQAMFRFDVGYPPSIGRAITFGIPLALLFVAPRDFLFIIGVVGSVFGASSGILAVLAGRVALMRRIGSTLWLHAVSFGAIVIFTLALIQQLVGK